MMIDLHLYRLSSFSSEPKEIQPHFQTDPPAYLECLLYSMGEEEVRKKSINGFNQKVHLKHIVQSNCLVINPGVKLLLVFDKYCNYYFILKNAGKQ